jgi:hypothetical protein
MISHKGQDQDLHKMSHYTKLEFPEGFSSVGSNMWMGNAMHNTF